MSNYGPEKRYKTKHIERQYYANTLHVNLLALVQKTGDEYPWATDEWQNNYPHLSRFLHHSDSDYGETEEDYFNIISDYNKLSEKEEWMLDSMHISLEKHLKKYVLPKPKSFKALLRFILLFVIGVFIGWLL